MLITLTSLNLSNNWFQNLDRVNLPLDRVFKDAALQSDGVLSCHLSDFKGSGVCESHRKI